MLRAQWIRRKIVGIPYFQLIGYSKLKHRQKSILMPVAHTEPKPLND